MSTVNNLYYFLTEEMKHSEEYDKVFKEYGEIYEKVLKLLPNEAKLLDELFIQTGGLENEFGLMCFKKGIKLAFALAIECFNSCS